MDRWSSVLRRLAAGAYSVRGFWGIRGNPRRRYGNAVAGEFRA